MPTQISGSTGVPASALPFLVGQVIFTAGSTVPSGFLKCNGAEVSRITYAALFTVCGTIYGAGDGSTTFNLPDLRGEFLRGLDDGRGVDSGRALGSWQSDSFKAHTHSVPSFSSNPVDHDSSLDTDRTVDTGSTQASGSAGSTETRPRNVALLACIFTGVSQ